MVLIDDAKMPTTAPDNTGISESNEEQNVDHTGGPSLCRSNEENQECIFISASVTIGANQTDGLNIHEQVAETLNDSTSLPESKSLVQVVNYIISCLIPKTSPNLLLQSRVIQQTIAI